MGNAHAKGYYLILKRNEILTHATTWMNLENTKAQSKEARYKHCKISFTLNSQNRQTYRDRKHISDCTGMEELGEIGVTASIYRIGGKGTKIF